MYYLSIMVLLFSVFLSGCGGGDCGGDCGGEEIDNNLVINGVIVDGYIRDAVIFIDLNKNNSVDGDEPQTKSNSDGQFSFTIDKTKILYPITVIGYGGQDNTTGNDFNQKLSYISYQVGETNLVLSPLSTLLTLMETDDETPVTRNEALANTANFFGINIDDILKDPIAVFQTNPNVYKANLKASSIARLITMQANQDLTPENVLKSYSAIADYILADKNFADMTEIVLEGQTIALGSSVDKIIQAIDTITTLPSNGTGYGDALESIIANNPPAATFTQFSMEQDSTYTGSLTAADAENSTLTFLKAGDPSHGSLVIDAANGSFTYIPVKNYIGLDTFSYKVNDGLLDSSVQAVTITINAKGVQNNAPVPTFTLFSVDENTVYSGTLTATDADNDTLVFIKASDPDHGTLILNSNGTFTYTPAVDYAGADSFGYKVNDGTVDSVLQNVTITVNAAVIQNNPPVPTFISFSTDENIVYNGTLTATDADNDPVTFIKVTNPAHGTLLVNASGAFTYTPAENYSGTDSFSYKADDGKTISALQDVTITINDTVIQNNPPIATFDSFSLDEDAEFNGRLTGTDADNDPLIFIKVNESNYGTLEINPDGTFSYTPEANFYGADTFSYKVNDGTDDSAVKLVDIVVKAVNDVPVPTFDYFKTMEDQPFSGTLTGIDADNDSLTFIKISNPEHGTLDLDTDGTFTYTPNLSYNGNDTFSYRVNDGIVNSEIQEVNITVSSLNEAPVATFDEFTADEDTLYTGALTATDGDNDALTYSKITDPLNGTLTLNSNGTFTYLANENYNGTDTFVYKVNDGYVDSGNKEVHITINAVNDAPEVLFAGFATAENTQVEGVLTATDADQDLLTFIKVSNPANGTLAFEQNGTFIYAPNNDFNGTDEFSYKVSDGDLESSVQTVRIIVSNVNNPPVATYNTFNILEDQNFTDVLSGYDFDRDPLIYSKVANPLHGTLVVETNGSFTYSPFADYSGLDSFTYRIYDGYDYSETHQVDIVVYSGNDQPVAAFDSFIMTSDTTYYGTLTAEDIDHDVLTYVLEQNATHAALFSLEDNGSFIYRPTADFEGDASFIYKVYDGMQYSNSQTVNIIVNDIPTIAAAAFSVDEDGEYNGTLQTTDIVHTAYVFSITAEPGHGTLTLDSNGSFTYQPQAGYAGADSFDYKVNDGYIDSAENSYNITVYPHNDVPVADFDTFTIDEDSVYNGVLTAVDDNNSVHFYIETLPLNGTLDHHDTNGSFRYTPNADYNGTDSFTYKVYDGVYYSSLKEVNITINAVNDAPVAVDLNITISEDTVGYGTVTAADVEGSVLTFSVTAAPIHGAVAMEANGSFTYTPAVDYNGTDSFEFKANDGALDSAVKTVTITITNINDTPVPTYTSFSTYENTIYKGTLTAIDADDDNLTYGIVLNPGNGTIVTTVDGNFTFTPNLDFSGSDSFTYKVNDGTVDSTEKRVYITVVASHGIKIAANDSHVSMIKNDGTLWSWGYNGNGELGDGTAIDKNSPVQIGTDENWMMVTAGHTHTLAVKADSTLWSWGLNADGQLGDGTNTLRTAPVQIDLGTSWKSIAAGNSHTIVIENNGTLWSWGFNNNGQLGDGTTTSVNTPVKIGTDTNWTQAAAGNHHTLAIKNGTGWSWGNNQYGQLGNGNTNDLHTPYQLDTDQNWTKAASGYYHSLGLKNGKLYTWGNNEYGQLGNNDAGNGSLVPIIIDAGSTWIDIAAGGSHSLAIKSDGTLWVWGYNDYGQLGDNSTTDSHIPKQIGLDADWVQIDAGEFFSIAVKNDGSVWTWGKNDDGQLGDGTNSNRLVPTLILQDNF